MIRGPSLKPEALLDSDAAISAAHDIVDLTVVHGVAPTLEAQQGVEGGLFRAGLAAATISWTNQTYLVAELPFELGFMHMPFVDRRVHGVGANHWCVNKASEPDSAGAAGRPHPDHRL